MAKSKSWLPFSPAWRAKYKEKLRDPKMTDAELQDREVKYRRTLYQTSISTGFYIGAHIGVAAATFGVTAGLAVVQLSWQAFNAMQANYKHKLVVEEIYRRGLTPRKMTKAEIAKTAFWATLSVALAQAIDNLPGMPDLFDGNDNSVEGMVNAVSSDPGQYAAACAAKGGSAALSFVLDGLAAGGVASAGLMASAGLKHVADSQWFASATSSRTKDAEALSTHANTTSGLLVSTRCTDCGARITARISAGMERRCTECQFAHRRKERQADKLAKVTLAEMTEDQMDEKCLATLHLDSFCDGCLDAIIGTRYSCMDCAEFDLCEECYHSPDFRLHVQNHKFNEAVMSPNEQMELTFVSIELASHQDIYCDGCRHDLVGLRMRCQTCPYFDLCNECFHGKWGQEHPHDHVFEQMI